LTRRDLLTQAISKGREGERRRRRRVGGRKEESRSPSHATAILWGNMGGVSHAMSILSIRIVKSS